MSDLQHHIWTLLDTSTLDIFTSLKAFSAFNGQSGKG